jgi:Mn2+/Fe2+ NRAMP family transporter
MVVVDLLAYVAEFAGIVLGASLIGIPAGPAVLAALFLHTVVVLTGSYRRFEVAALVLSLALFAFVVLAFAAGPDPRAVLGGLSPAQPFDRPGYLDLVVATVGAVIMPWMLFYQQWGWPRARGRRAKPWPAVSRCQRDWRRWRRVLPGC